MPLTGSSQKIHVAASGNALHGAALGFTGEGQTSPLGSPITVAFNVTTFDTDAFSSGSTLIVPSGLAGRYTIRGCVYFSDPGTPQPANSTLDFDCSIRKGAAVQGTDRLFIESHTSGWTNARFPATPHVERTLVLAAGDVISLQASSDRLYSFSVYNGWLEAIYLG
jgi:hypothetical protein